MGGREMEGNFENWMDECARSSQKKVFVVAKRI
jgi:hypothetical protein